MWPDVPFRHYQDGWRRPEVAPRLWSLAPRSLHDFANVRMPRTGRER